MRKLATPLMNPKNSPGKLNVSFIKYRLKVFINRILKSIHNFFYAINIDIRIRKKEVSGNAIQINSIDAINKFYSETDKQFELMSAGHQKFFHEIIKTIESYGVNLKDKEIADFGCGIGNLLLHVNNYYQPAICYGFDFSETLLNIAKKRFPEGHFNQHDIYIKIKQQFNFVFCTEVIEHLLYPDRALVNILATIKTNGGGAFISVPDGRKDNFAGHINFWSPESWDVFIRSQVDENAKVETGYVTPNNLYAIVLFHAK